VKARDEASNAARSQRVLAAVISGAALGVAGTGGVALLLFTERGFLATAGFLVSVLFVSVAAAAWVGGGRDETDRRAWSIAIVAFGMAAAFAAFWVARPALREASFGGPAAVLFLLAGPAYAAGVPISRVATRDAGIGAAAIAGVGIGVLAAAGWGIPRLDAPFLFLAAALALAAAAPLDRQAIIRTRQAGMVDKVAIITGVGNAGQVGFAIAQTFVQAGARLVITGLSDDVEQLAERLGADVRGVRADLTRPDDAARVVATAIDLYGRIDTLINVAGGLGVIKSVEETSVHEWAREFERNATTAFIMSRAALPHLRATHGSIVNFASPAASRAPARLAAYSAAKAAVQALTRSLALEERDHGVRVNAIAPGMIDTAQNRAEAGDQTAFVARDDIAALTLFLAGPAGAALNGATLPALGPTLR
jgi:NAD(P)-dependent dehydrogenase (short-subunit alcohol dehydrogenase family)